MLDKLPVLSIAFAMGCTGLIEDGGNGGLTPEQAEAKRAWIAEAQPVLAQNCGACHNGSRANIGFLEGSDALAQRDDLLTYEPQVVNMTAPQSSRVLTKGLHEGPAFTASQTATVLGWIQKQKDAEGSTGEQGPSLETAPFIPQVCTGGTPGSATCPFNDVTLDALGVAGAKIQFTVQSLGSGLYLSNMKLIPGPDGAYIEHPLFVSKPNDGNAKPDTIDRFFNVKMNLQAAATDADRQIAGGTAAFVGFQANDPLTIYFKAVKTFQMDMGGGMQTQSGCKKLTEFKAIRTSFSAPVAGAAQACTQCHAGQNAGATGALLLTNIGSADDMVVQGVCNQVLIRTNLTTPDASGIFIAPDPAAAGHPFKFAAGTQQLTTFKTNLTTWIMAEKTAP
jgi:mono/diheme cytochrome c family protein